MILETAIISLTVTVVASLAFADRVHKRDLAERAREAAELQELTKEPEDPRIAEIRRTFAEKRKLLERQRETWVNSNIGAIKRGALEDVRSTYRNFVETESALLKLVDEEAAAIAALKSAT